MLLNYSAHGTDRMTEAPSHYISCNISYIRIHIKHLIIHFIVMSYLFLDM
jgi:hypothetical protein